MITRDIISANPDVHWRDIVELEDCKRHAQLTATQQLVSFSCILNFDTVFARSMLQIAQGGSRDAAQVSPALHRFACRVEGSAPVWSSRYWQNHAGQRCARIFHHAEKMIKSSASTLDMTTCVSGSDRMQNYIFQYVSQLDGQQMAWRVRKDGPGAL
eukprot:SAG31_NODE_3856_length_3815_cov_3.607374_5_plen_157_part_00